MPIEVERLIDLGGGYTVAYYCRGHVPRAEFVVALRDWVEEEFAVGEDDVTHTRIRWAFSGVDDWGNLRRQAILCDEPHRGAFLATYLDYHAIEERYRERTEATRGNEGT